ncbi:MAG: PE-PGRS family protein, partial [Halothiobacillaceae bacterium]
VILGLDILGGPGSGGDYGLYINGGTIQSSVINLSAGSMGLGSTEYGINLSGTVTAQTITLIGTGGGLYSGAGTQNYGIYLNGIVTAPDGVELSGFGGVGSLGNHHGIYLNSFIANTPALTFQNCIGGNGGSDNCGVNIAADFSLATGTLEFINLTGGGTSSNNHGLLITATVTAPTIITTDLFGGPGSSGDYGFYLNGGTINSSNLIVVGGSLGIGTNEIGVVVNSGTLNATTVTLTGTGGGLYSSSGQQNYGISLNNAVFNAANAVTLTGVGGTGTGGQHHGVFVYSANPNTLLCTFLNCTGGSGGSSNYGVDLNGSITMVSGTLQFTNVTGGGTGLNNYGVYIGAIVTAPMILGSDIYGGPGSGNDYGLNISGSLVANEVLISAGSLGLVSSEIGINLTGSVVANTTILTGIGGGLYSGAGAGNYGVFLSGTVSGATLTGIGGVGTGGTHHGVTISGATANNSLTITNSSGGTGGESNYGVNIIGNLTLVSGTLLFSNITGGGNSTSNYGISISGTVIAPIILGFDIYGGPGVGTSIDTGNVGLFFASASAVLGSAATSQIYISAGSLGVGSFELGIHLDSGNVTVGDGGSITLIGMAGGTYSNSTGASNEGIRISGGTFVAGNGSSAVNAIALTGIGGTGGAGANYGINITVATTASLNGTNNSDSFSFINCAGGTGGNNNDGLRPGTFTLNRGTLFFQNIVGGGTTSSNTNNGIRILATVVASEVLVMVL